jgi:hypothetical protein
MGCGCKNKKGKTPAQALVFGDETGDEPIRVVPTVAIANQQAGTPIWVKGSQLGAFLENRWLVPVDEYVRRR